MAYPHSVQPKKCSKKSCTNTYTPHHWGTKQAGREGWFMQRNGVAWCPKHIPDWVAEWRKKKAEEK